MARKPAIGSPRGEGGDGGDGQKTPLFTIDFEKDAVEERVKLPRELEEPEQIDKNFFSLEANPAAAAKVSVACMQIHLLNLVSWPEYKWIWGKKCIQFGWWTFCFPYLYIYRRICTRSYYLQVCHPTIKEIFAAILECLKQTLSPALLALLVQKKFSQFLAVIQIVLVNCLREKGVKLLHMLSFGIKEQVHCSNWVRIN